MEFEKTFKLMIEDIIQSVTPEELEKREDIYHKVYIVKDYFDRLIRQKLMVKNDNGTYDVNSNVDISGMRIETLKSLPYAIEIVKHTFDCSLNNLTNLEGLPTSLLWSVDCSYNQLTSLEGCPEKINGTFNCKSNMLNNLKGCPKNILIDFICVRNKLTSLVGCPAIINGDFYCSRNNLTSLEGCPKEVKGNFYITNMKNEFKFKKEDVWKVCNVRGDIFV